jgi:polysaccharide biosynthesis transport protein
MDSVSQTSQIVTMADAVRGIGQRKFLVLMCLILGVLSGLAVLALLKPSYQSEAQVIIENLATPFENVNSVQIDTRSEPINERVVASQVSVLKSGDMGARVVDSLNLSTKPEFNALLKSPSVFKSTLIAVGFADDPRLLTPIQLAQKQLDSHLTVYPTPESNVIGIKYQSSDPQTSADVANAIADTYVLSTRETVAGSTARARDWLQQQIDDLRKKVSASESAVEKYRAEAGLLVGEKSTLGTQQLSELNSQISLAEAASSEAAARADEIRNLLAQKGSVDASSDVLSSALIQNLRGQQSAATQKMSELSAVYLPNHPKMIAARQELTSIERNIRTEANKIIDSLIGQAKVAAARAQSLRSSLDKLKGAQATANLSDVKLQELERDSQASKVLLEQMLNRYADVNSRQDLSLQPGFARVIQKAVPLPSNYFPKPGPIMALTSFGGLTLGLGLAFLFSVMSASTARPRVDFAEREIVPARATLAADETLEPAPLMDIAWPMAATDHAAAPVPPPIVNPPSEKALAVLCSMPSASSLVGTLAMVESTYSGIVSPVTEAATRIATSCLALKEMQGMNTVALTSIGGRGMDASVTIVAVTRALAAAKKKIVAVDLSSLNSPFETMFEIPNGCGISDLVAGEADFTKVICRDPHSSAHVIRYGLKTAPQFQTTVADKLAPILKALTGIYDLVLIHVGEATSTTPSLVKECKGTMLLAPQSRYKDAVAAARVLESKGMEFTMFVRLEPAGDSASKTAATG